MFRIPNDLKIRLQIHSRRTRMSMAAIIYNALMQYLDLKDGEPNFEYVQDLPPP
jgi:predicted transcriptional regulator